jgi:hypothetical protein
VLRVTPVRLPVPAGTVVLRVTPVRFPVPADLVVLLVQPDGCDLWVVVVLAGVVVVCTVLVVGTGVEFVTVTVCGCHGLVGTAMVMT